MISLSTNKYKLKFLNNSFKVTVFLAFLVLIPNKSNAFDLKKFFSEPVLASSYETNKDLETIQNMSLLGEEDFSKSKDSKKTFLGNLLSFNSLSLQPNLPLEEEMDHSHDESVIYTVKKGESLQSIASYFEVSVDTIVTFNKLEERKVFEGDVLEIPSISGILYTIKKGDTISSIAKSYSLDPEDISLFNGIIPNVPLEINSDIFLPGAKPLKEENKKVSKIKLNSPLSKKTTIADKLAINVLNKNKYSTLQKLEDYFINPAPSARRSQKLHGNNAVDLAGPVGTPILAAADGVVTVARSSGWNYGYGQYLVISHPNGTQTVYAHLSNIFVNVGQNVKQGEKIAGMGNTGNSTGPHLHFEVRGAYNKFAW